MKKATIHNNTKICLILSLFCTVLLHNTAHARKNFEGFHIGFGLDKIHAHVDAEAAKTSTSFQLPYYTYSPFTYHSGGYSTSTISMTTNNSASTLGVNFIFGYSWRLFDYLYLGTNFTWIVNQPIAAGGANYIADINPEFSLDGRMGLILFDKALLYGLGGFEFAIANVRPFPSSGIIDPYPKVSSRYSSSGTNNISGLKIGGGVEFKVQEKMNMRLEYYQVNYAKVTRSIQDNSNFFYPSYINDNFKFRTQTFRVSFIFY